MNKYLITFLISAGIGICYLYNVRDNQIKTLGIKEVNMDKINKDIIKLETIKELKNEELKDEELKDEELKDEELKDEVLKDEELKDYTEHVENKDRYRIVVYRSEGWEIVN